ncbi:Hypothetical protein POVR2_LOCUS107 [uncultured virus]|nr:Hypothetical protein POVR2_LOCUS107 [uncultured virus]
MESLLADPFSLIVDNIDDKSLVQLYNTSIALREKLDPLLRARASKLTKNNLAERQNADWMRIYSNLVLAEQHMQAVEVSMQQPESNIRWSGDHGHTWLKFDPWKYGMNHLDSLLALVEVHGDIPKDYGYKHTMTSGVISHLISLNILDRNDTELQASIAKAIERHDLPEVLAMLAFYSDEQARDSAIYNAILMSARLGKLVILKALVKQNRLELPRNLLLEAVESNNRDVVKFVISLGADEELLESRL